MDKSLLSIAIFMSFGLVFVLGNMIIGMALRPSLPNEEKGAIYECGEPTVGSSWVQFDLRFYIVALFYLIFDVEVALIYPWAVIFKDHAFIALVAGAPFLLIIVIGYVYEWYSGSLDWVRHSVNESYAINRPTDDKVTGLGGVARRDPEALADEADGKGFA